MCVCSRWCITYFFIRSPTQHMTICDRARLFPGGISTLLTQPNFTDSETEMETESIVNRTDLFWLLVVGAVWGITNPFLKRRSTLSAHPEGQNMEADKEKIDGDSGSHLPNWRSDPFGCFCSFWLQLLTDWQYVVPFLINLSGSVLFISTLADSKLSLAVPIANASTFVFTAVSGTLLGEKLNPLYTILGVALVVTGVVLCQV